MTPQGTIKILIISPIAETVQNWLFNAMEEFSVEFYSSLTGISGIDKLQSIKPALAIIDSELSDINGMSLTAIIKNTLIGSKTEIFLFNLNTMYPDIKADQICFKVQENNLRDFLTSQSRLFVEKIELERRHEDEIIKAKALQYEYLPEQIDTENLQVHYVFSPYGDLSGDGCDFWLSDNDKTKLYGFLFDCTGHDLTSFSQCSEFRMLLKKNLRLNEMGLYSSLSQVVESINQDLFMIDKDPPTAAAIVFCLDMEKRIFHFASAGINVILKKEISNLNYEEVITPSSPFGYEPDIKYEDESFELDGIDGIIISSDGFTEVMVSNSDDLPKENIAKHDDVTAIFINIPERSISR
ncbi:MAG: SpoIIE family protein phosphatase [Selenomonadaceae bacterium]|nr:SpoIIE family protein phosphatase [Selenomonadaceae bacterium]